jgi:glycosyltransferase involved in cell wall biosynthesis
MTLARLVGAIDRSSVESIVISLGQRGALACMIEDQGIPLYSLNMQRGRPNVAAITHLRKILKDTSPDIVQTWLYHADFAGLIAGRMAGVPSVLWNIRCSSLEHDRQSMSQRLLLRTLAHMSGWPAAVVANSAEGRRSHERCGYHPRAWHIIPNGVDTEVYRPDESLRVRMRDELGFQNDEVAFGIVGRLHPMKDHASFLRAAAAIGQASPHGRFVLVGRDIAADPSLRALAACLPSNRIVMLGERNDIPTVLNGLDVMVCCSSYGEGFPNAVAEAMAVALPVVSTAVGDAAEIVHDAGAIVPPRNTDALRSAMRDLLELPPAARREIGARGRERVLQHYSLSLAVARYQKLYQDVVQRRRVAA